MCVVVVTKTRFLNKNEFAPPEENIHAIHYYVCVVVVTKTRFLNKNEFAPPEENIHAIR